MRSFANYCPIITTEVRKQPLPKYRCNAEGLAVKGAVLMGNADIIRDRNAPTRSKRIETVRIAFSWPRITVPVRDER